MSVGASSIKRAARTAAAEEPKEAGTEGKAAENVESAAERGAEKKRVGKRDRGEENMAGENREKAKAPERGAAGASVKADGKKPASKASRITKNTKSRMPQKASAADKPKTSVAENDAAEKGQAYEAYGIGQQLPVHLL